MLGINSHALPVQGVQRNYGLLSVSVGAKRVAQTTRRTRNLTDVWRIQKQIIYDNSIPDQLHSQFFPGDLVVDKGQIE